MKADSTLLFFVLVIVLVDADDWLKPMFHHTPAYRYGPGGTGGDTAGAVYSQGRWHTFALSRQGVQHASTTDLVHWSEHGVVGNLDDSGGVTIDPSDGVGVALSAGGLKAKLSVSTDPDLMTWGPMEAIFHTTDDRSPAMPFPGDPLAPWRDHRDGRWYTALAIDACNASTRVAKMGEACPHGGLQQLWSSPALRGLNASWTTAGTLLQANHTAPRTGSYPQVTEFVTPDFYAPGSLATSPTNDTAVFISSVYGPWPCCMEKAAVPRWNFQQYLVGRQPEPGGEFVVDWDRSGAMDYSQFVPLASGQLNVTYGPQFGCCAKSAFTPEGRRVLLHAGLQNGGAGGNETENSFALPREHFFDADGNFRQSFVSELVMLRRKHYPAVRFHLSHAGLVSVPRLAGLQLEIRARLIQSGARSMDFSWGVAVLASPDLSSATRLGFRHFRKSSGKTLPGHVFVDRSLALGNPVAARDVRAGPLPSSTDEEELHLFVDHSIVSMMASNETAITLWSHPATQESSVVALFAEGAEAEIEIEAWQVAAAATRGAE